LRSKETPTAGACRKSETNSGRGSRLHNELGRPWWRPVRTRSGDDQDFGEILERVSGKMIKILTIAALLLLGTMRTSAAPTKHWYQKGPLGATERSIGCMMQPWKDWKCAGLHYAIFGANLFDYKSSQYALRNCFSCAEINPMFGSGRPSPARMFAQGMGLSLLTEHTFAQYAYERNPRKSLVVAGIFVGIHASMGIRQYGMTTDSTVRSLFCCPACAVVR
jgi:hypothetical protein